MIYNNKNKYYLGCGSNTYGTNRTIYYCVWQQYIVINARRQLHCAVRGVATALPLRSMQGAANPVWCSQLVNRTPPQVDPPTDSIQAALTMGQLNEAAMRGTPGTRLGAVPLHCIAHSRCRNISTSKKLTVRPRHII